MLWQYVKPAVRECENQNGVLILDDSIEDKPYTDENEVNCWHYSHAKGDIVKGINFLSCMVRYDDFCLPIGYEIIKKDIEHCDIKTKQHRRKATVNKNQHFRQLMIKQLCFCNFDSTSSFPGFKTTPNSRSINLFKAFASD